jgi:hypothetical protein
VALGEEGDADPLRSGGRPRSARFMAREQVGIEQAASHERCLVPSPSPGMGMVRHSPQGGDMRKPRVKPWVGIQPWLPSPDRATGSHRLSTVRPPSTVETIPTRCRPFRAREYVGIRFPGPCPGLSHSAPTGRLPILLMILSMDRVLTTEALRHREIRQTAFNSVPSCLCGESLPGSWPVSKSASNKGLSNIHIP